MGAIVLTSICLLIDSGEDSRTGVMASDSINPALEMRKSSLLIPCVDLSSETAVNGSVSEVESIVMGMILLFWPRGMLEKIERDEERVRTAAMMVVFGRETSVVRRPLPIPRLAPVMR